MNAAPSLDCRRCARVKSMAPAVRSAKIEETALPSRVILALLPLAQEQMSETRTAAPSTIQGSSLQTLKIVATDPSLSKDTRFAPLRIEFVATNPMTLVRWLFKLPRAFSNQ